ncbi:hypothetical protein [Lutispora sp.]|uniref:hypothetical protein n=1 Tax=Lutispora sp. TaxID=2828727 RepID=UPI002B1F3F8F|nr:hypothetical protein [Lutispora sp.]MEA4960157.1 hypothetical protein [Lutispora sp.]
MVSQAASKLDKYANKVVRVDDSKIKEFTEALTKAVKGESVGEVAAASYDLILYIILREEIYRRINYNKKEGKQ